MFYKKVNKNSNKEMFEFLNNHFEYFTMSSWNLNKSIANNVKIYNLGLDWEILNILQVDNYFTLNCMIEDWEMEHPGYKVGFNGRSGGYLVLYNEDNTKNVLDWLVTDYDNYEQFKEHVKYHCDSLKNYEYELKRQVELVQDFDKLCDDLLEECKYMLEHYQVVEKERQVTQKYFELEEVF